MRLGHGQRRSVLILWAWTAILSGFALLPVYTDRAAGLVPFAAAALAVALYTVLHPEVRRSRAGDADQLEFDLDGSASSRRD
jgi:UDP-GlcNAc:undecaprenyl-phosphate GlcNAc-1-phosphate transferase